jgi:hypothetical protein
MPIGIECMSSVCAKCTEGLSHEVDVCPKNHTGTAKGMESHGAAKIARRVFDNPSAQVHIHSLVTDDDSLVHRILTHSFKKKADAGRMAASDWPRYGKNETGGKMPDVGLLPLLHAEIVFLADNGHRNRNYSGKNFGEAGKPKKSGCGMTKVDAERMKRRMSHTLRLHTKGTYDEFRVAVMAVLEHHFDVHEFCGAWCPVRTEGSEGDVSKGGLRFRCKTRNKDMHLFMKKNHEEFMEDAKLRQLFHQRDTQKVEGFNKLLTKFLHKDKTHCQTIENAARCHLAVGIQSVGCTEFYRRIFELTGVESVEDDVTTLFLGSEDQDKLKREAHQKKKSVKIQRMRDQMKKTREGAEKLKRDNQKALTYESGMMGPGVLQDEVQGVEEGSMNASEEGPTKRGGWKRRGSQRRLSCKHCGSATHMRITSKHCPKNPNLNGGEVLVGEPGASEMKSWERHTFPM